MIDQAHRNLGRLAIAEGDYPTARVHLTICLTEYRTANGPHAVAAGVEHLARVAIAEGSPERAVRLLSAAATLRERAGVPLTALESAAVQHWRAMARDVLGADTFTAAWQTGAELAEDEVIALATAPPPASVPIDSV